jgi:hypothetical protein
MLSDRTWVFAISLFLSLVIAIGGGVAIVTKETTFLNSLKVVSGADAVFFGVLQIGIAFAVAILSYRKFRK